MKKIFIIGVVIVVIGLGIYSIIQNSGGAQNSAPAQTAQQVSSTTLPAQTAADTATTTPVSVTLMQSTGLLFASSTDYSKAHEVFPTMVADSAKALGAFGIAKTALADGAYTITLTNGPEGYQGQSVTVGANQSVYFIERSSGDDSPGEDSVTKDDYLVVVDAQGTILK